MADNKSRGELSIKVNVDVSEALTGLKAIQREARDAAKALRELEEAQKRSQALPTTRIDGGGGTISSTSEGFSNKGRKSDYEAIFKKSVMDDIRRSYE